MNTVSTPRSHLDRWLALVVRYWVFNMTLALQGGARWWGFGYTDEERATMQELARREPDVEYFVWLGLVVIFMLLLITAIMLASIAGLDVHAPAVVFFQRLGVAMVVSLAVGLPLAMLPAAALVGHWFAVQEGDLPDRGTTAHYFYKLWFQIARIAVLGTLAVISLCVFVPDDSRFWTAPRWVVPLLAPAVSALTATYYWSLRLRSRR